MNLIYPILNKWLFLSVRFYKDNKVRVYHFINEKYGLDDLRNRRLKISRLMDLNDPFEFLGVELSSRERRDAVLQVKAQLSESHGLLCFCKGWKSPLMWGHYADKHQGLCLGFDVGDDFIKGVDYVGSRLPWPEGSIHDFVKKLLFFKFSQWRYEEEYRLYCKLNEKDGDFYFANFSSEMKLVQVIVGANSNVSRSQVVDELGDLSGEVEVFKARAAFKSFRIVRNRNESSWV